MASYSKKTCHSCGIRLPQPDMIAKTIQVETGNSRKTLSGSELVFAALGNKKAQKAVGRTFTSPNKRRYVRNKDVWECYNCAGVETPEEKRIRLEHERIAKENALKQRSILQAQEQAARQMRLAEKAERLAISRSNRLRDGSFTRFLVAFVPQFLLSFVIIYIPISEFYLRRFSLGGVKFVSFYVAVISIAANASNNEFGLIFTVPLVTGVVDFVSGFLFFKQKIHPECLQVKAQAPVSPSLPPALPPPLPTKESGDGLYIADKKAKQKILRLIEDRYRLVSLFPTNKQTIQNMNTEQLETLFQEAEEHLMVKSVLVGVGPPSMVGVILTPEAYDDGIKCLITVECTEDEELDDDKLELISDTVSDHLRENWDLNSKLTDIGIDPDTLNWWPVCTQGV